MEQKSLANWLKIVIGGTGICGTIFYLVLILGIGRDLIEKYPEFSYWFTPWTVFIIISAIPCYITLIIGWKIANNIGNDKSFIIENAVLLGVVSKLAAVDSGFFLVGNIALWLTEMNHPSVVIASLFVSFAGVVFSVAMAVISHQTRKAAQLKEESELTI
ncbi:MAG: DUF2975 domain-containing protein [Lachnospiraceae bacterium]|nr:DUF2975 domain-containing protein [Lachnospiraceae bacterium]